MNQTIPTFRIQRTSLQVELGSQRYHFDRTGRFLFLTEPGRAIRRGLDHRMVESIQVRHDKYTYRQYRDLTTEEKDTFLNKAYHIATDIDGSVDERVAVWLRNVKSWDAKKLAQDAQAFTRVYKPVTILPPDQYGSLVIQIAEGCSYNRCLFCDFYRDRPFHIKDINELQEHLTRLKAFFGSRVMDRTVGFLGDGNALIVPTEKLLSMLDIIKQALPHLSDGFVTFMDTFNLERKTVEELRQIRAQDLHTVYVGLESGSNRLREFLNKPGTIDEAMEAIRLLKQAGFHVGIILLVGVGGHEFEQEHLQETLHALQNITLDRDDMIYLSPFVEPQNATYHEKTQAASVDHFSEIEKVQKLYDWKQKVAQVQPNAKVSFYSIQQHLY